MSVIVGGKNNFGQIHQTNTQSEFKIPTLYENDFSDISYSVYNDFAIAISENHCSYGVGNNANHVLKPSKPYILKHFFGIHFNDSKGNPYNVESAVCGLNYSLFQFTNNDKPDEPNFRFLYYIFGTKKIKNHAYLDTQVYKIVSIYGGSEISAAIDE
ncbi:hypothetical protein M9Y10_014658 [Tritrichomonas musculus]|uniref:Uncharacterized protein n=1 Tax=Tritrichomonas musculus TaxID=1915356 RepID=A0ABR2L050_9EUKA